MIYVDFCMRVKIFPKLDETCLQSTGWLKLLKEKLVQALLEMLVSSGEINFLEINVVALKSDATMYCQLCCSKGKEGGSLKALNSWINSEFLYWGITESSQCIS